MTSPSDKKSEGARESTTIDLGEDLLERTVSAIHRAPVVTEDGAISPPLPEYRGVEDQLQSALILMNEGFVEDAKSVLRKVLVHDPRNLSARQRLDEIHDLELKQIFSGVHEPRQRRAVRGGESQALTDPDDVLARLDADLGLGLATDSHSLLSNEDDRLNGLGDELEKTLHGASARDRIDLGIAFLEMGMFEVAARQFRVASRDPEERVPATALLAQALIGAGKAFDAVLALEPLLADTEIDDDGKLELIYLVARAHESLGRKSEAATWYRRVVAIDRRYRDCTDRLRALQSVHGRPGRG